MNAYEELVDALKDEYGSSKSVTDPDWSQEASWIGYIPKEVRKAWKEMPYETQLLLYFMAGQAYRQGL